MSLNLNCADSKAQWLGKRLNFISFRCIYIYIIQELADAVIVEQLKDVQYKSTDRVMKYSEFQQLCQRLVPAESTRVLECYLQSQRLIAKERTKSGLEVCIVCSTNYSGHFHLHNRIFS